MIGITHTLDSLQSPRGRLRAYRISDRVVEHMGYDRWKSTIGWAENDEEFASLLEKYRQTMQAVVYTRHDSDEPLAMGLVIVENWSRRIASFHGGGWNTPWDNYDCAHLLVSAMKIAGWHIMTSVAIDNRRAQRFVTSLGMERYRTVKGRYLYRFHKGPRVGIYHQ